MKNPDMGDTHKGIALVAGALASFLTPAIQGLGFGLFSSPNANAAMSSVEKGSYGIAAGILATMRLIGQTLSMGIAMVVFTLLIGRAQILTGA